MNEDLLLGLYQKGGFDKKGSLDKFKEDMLSSPELRKGVFDKLGLGEKGTYDQFEKDLAITSPQVIEPLIKYNAGPVGVARPAVMANPGIENEKLKDYYATSRKEMVDASFVPGPAGRDSFKPPQAVEKSMVNAAKAEGLESEVKAAQLLNRQEDVLTAAKTIYATDFDKKKESYSKNPQIAEVEFANEALNHYRDNAHLIADRSRERLKIIHGDKYNANEIDKAVNTYGALMIMGRIEDANKFIEKYPELKDDQNLRNVVNANMKLRETTKAQVHVAHNNPEWVKRQQKKIVAGQATDAVVKALDEEAPDFIADPAKFGINARASVMNTIGKWAKNFAVTPGMRDWGRDRMDFNPKSSDYQGRAIEEYKKVGGYDVVYDGGKVAYVRDNNGYIVQLDEDKMKSIEAEAKGKESQKRFNPKPFVGQTADVILDMAPIIAITAATGGAGTALGMAGSTARGIGVVAGSMLQTRGDIMDQMLLHPDISKTEAEMYTLGIGTGIGLISLINPIEARILSKGIPGIVAGNAGKLLNKSMTKGQLAWNITKDVGTALGAEPLEEIIQEYFQYGALNAVDKDQPGYGRFRNNEAPTGDDLLEIGLVSAAVGLLGGAGDIRFSRNAFVDEALDRALTKPKIMEDYLAGQKDGAESIVDPEKKQAALDHIERITERWESLKTNVASIKGLKGGDRGKLAALIVDSNALESELNGITNSELIAAKKAEIKDVNDQIKEIITPTASAAPAAPGATTVTDEDPEDARRRATQGLGLLTDDGVETEIDYFEEGQDIEDDTRLEGDKKGKIISVNNNAIRPGESKPSVHSIEIEYEDGTKRTKVIARRTPAETGIRVIGKKDDVDPLQDVESKKADIEKKRQEDLLSLDNRDMATRINTGSTETIKGFIEHYETLIANKDYSQFTDAELKDRLNLYQKALDISIKYDDEVAAVEASLKPKKPKDPPPPPPASAGAAAPEEDKAPKPRKNKLSPNIGDKLTGESGAKYTIRGTSEKTGAIQFNTATGGRGSWSIDRFEEAVNSGRLTYDDEAATPMPAAKSTPEPTDPALTAEINKESAKITKVRDEALMAAEGMLEIDPEFDVEAEKKKIEESYQKGLANATVRAKKNLITKKRDADIKRATEYGRRTGSDTSGTIERITKKANDQLAELDKNIQPDEKSKRPDTKTGQGDNAEGGTKGAKPTQKGPKTTKSAKSAFKRAKRISEKASEALKLVVGNNPEAMAMQYLLENKINSAVIRSMYGGKNRGGDPKKIKGEVTARLTMINNMAKALNISSLGDEIWAYFGSPDLVTGQDLANAVESVIQDYTTVNQIAEALLTKFSDPEIDEELKWMMAQTGQTEVELLYAMNFLSTLTDEQIQAIADDEADFANSPEYREMFLGDEVADVEEETEEDEDTEEEDAGPPPKGKYSSDSDGGDRLSNFKQGDIVYRNYNGRYQEFEIVDARKDIWKLKDTTTGVISPWNAANNGGFFDLSKDDETATTERPSAILSSFDRNIEALTNPKTGLGATVKKALEEQRPYKEAFLKRNGLTPSQYDELDQTKKDALTEQWIKSPEFAELSRKLDNATDADENTGTGQSLSNFDEGETVWRKVDGRYQEFEIMKNNGEKPWILKSPDGQMHRVSPFSEGFNTKTAQTDTSNSKFSVDDTVTFTDKNGKEFEASFRGYNGEDNAVIVIKGGNQMQVPVGQLKAYVEDTKLPPEDPSALPEFESAEAMPATVRELVEMDAAEQNGYVSGLLLSSVKLDQTFKVAGKTYTVTKITKPVKATYDQDSNGKNYKGSYTKYGVTIKDDKGNTYSYELWSDWILNGDKMMPGIRRRGETRSKDPVGQLSRDIEGDITVDLINENKRNHVPSDSYRIVQRELDRLNLAETPVSAGSYRHVSQQEATALLNGDWIRESGDASVAVTNKESSQSPYRISFSDKPSFNKNGVAKLGSNEYSIGGVSKIESRNADGSYTSVYTSGIDQRPSPSNKTTYADNRNVDEAPPTPTKIAQRKVRDEKLEQSMKDKMAALKKALKNNNNLTSGGVNPEALAIAISLVGDYMQAGVNKFSDMIEDLYAQLGEDLSDLFPSIKAAYSAYRETAPDDEADQMDESLRKFTYESLTDKFREDVSDQPRDRQPDRGGRNNQTESNTEPIQRPDRGSGRSTGGKTSGRGNQTDKEGAGGKGNSSLLTPPLGTQSDLFLHPEDRGPGPKTDSPGDADGRGNSTDSSKGSDADGLGNAGIDSGTKKAIGGFKERTRLAKKKQDEVEDVPVIIMDEANIRETLPLLLDEQQDDVIKAEHRFNSPAHKNEAQANGKGMMFTNATGTGKSFVALGIVKRFVKQGKKNILIVAPSQPKLTEWVRDAKLLNLDLTKLTGVKDGGQGFNATTFHNFTVNKELLKRDFDLIIYDESHHVMEDKDGNESSATGVHKMMGNMNERQALARLQDGHPLWKRQNEIMLEYRQIADSKLTPNISTTERQQKIKALELQLDVLKEKQDKVLPAMRQRAKEAVDRTKVVFLSATPFKAVKSLGYTNGFLFDWGNETIVNNKGSRINAEEQFYLKNFGSKWQWKNHRLEPKDPPNEAAVAMQEIAFAEKLMAEGVMSGRPIESNMDYSRDFPKVTGFNSDRFNEAFLSIYNYEHNEFARLRDTAKDVFFNHLYTIPLFESLKTSMSIDRIKKQLALDRKVVVFHRRRESNVRPPFETIYEGTIAKANEVLMERTSTDKAKEEAVSAINQAEAFKERFADLFEYEQTLNYSPTVEQLKAAFPEITTFLNGDVKKKGEKDAAIKNFNDDNSPIKIIVIQENSGREGISLHDTTGKHQRVLMSMSMPNSTTTALQVEGRIYRIGQESNAVIEYPLLGIDLETAYFGSNLNKRLGTTENLAMGKQSRNLTRSFAEGVLFNSTTDDPHTGQGLGGKEYDKRLESSASPFDEAKLIYASNQKITGRRDQREGDDFYATPEPLGQKMVHWSDNRVGDHTLEPSAGKGAISMWFPNTVASTAIEPAFDLYSQAQTRTGGSDKKVLNGKFEDHNIINKYDTIVMNPPFGVGGKVAMEHVEKAFKHLRDGGRIVALVPVGQMDKRIEQFLYGTDEKERQLNPNAYLRKRILLPQATFQQQGTQVMTQILIIDKVLDHENAPENEGTIDLRNSKNINEFFDNIEFTEVPDRIVRKIVETDEAPSQQNVESKPVSQGDIIAPITEHKDTRNGAIWHSAKMTKSLGDEYQGVKKIAIKHGGEYSRFTKTFLFKSKDGAEAFRNEINGSPQFSMDPLLAPNGKPSNLTPAQHAQVRTPAFKKWFGDWENANKLMPVTLEEIQQHPELYRKAYSSSAVTNNAKIITKNGETIYLNKAINQDFIKAYALKDGKLEQVGTLVIDPSNMFKPDPSITFHDTSQSILVEPEYRRLGIGTALIDFAEQVYKLPIKESKLTSPSLKATLDNRNSVSKVVDENGEPLVVYHGSGNSAITEFTEQKIPGYWFADTQDVGKFAKGVRRAENPTTYSAFLNIRNPKEYDGFWREFMDDQDRMMNTGDIASALNPRRALMSAIKKDYDGILIGEDTWNDTGDDNQITSRQFVAFDSNQIKSTDNTGAFDPTNNDIRFSLDAAPAIMPDVVNGFYSPLEKIIGEAKADKLPVKQWIEKFAKGDEAKWTGLTDWLGTQEGSVSKSDILNYLENNRVEIKEVVYGDSSNFDDQVKSHEEKKEDIQTELRSLGYEMERDMAGEIYLTIKGKDEPIEDEDEIAALPSRVRALGMAYADLNENFEYDDDSTNTKYSGYTLPGEKTNYKEVLVTLPVTITQLEEGTLPEGWELYNVGETPKDPQYWNKWYVWDSIKQRSLSDGKSFDTEEEVHAYAVKVAKQKGLYQPVESGRKFDSNHWSEPNILTHIRMDTRVDANGDKALFLEELQSDWAQKGRKEGFKLSPKDQAEADRLEKIYLDAEDAASAYWDANANNQSVGQLVETDPAMRELFNKEHDAWVAYQAARKGTTVASISQAPFVTDTAAWTKLALKVATKEAVKQGISKIAWTTGEQQAERYSLSIVISKIDARKIDDDLYRIKIWKNDGSVWDDTDVAGHEIEPMVGKEISDQILAGTKTSFEGLDLKVGGKGMTGYYGDPVKNKLGILGNVAKSMFGEVGTVEMDLGTNKIYHLNKYSNAKQFDESEYDFFDGRGNKISKDQVLKNIDENYTDNTAVEKGGETQHSVTITPELRNQVKTQGLPLFSIQAAEAAAASSNPDPNGPIIIKLRDAGASLEDDMKLYADVWIDLVEKQSKPFINRGLELIKGTEYDTGNPRQDLAKAIGDKAAKSKKDNKLINWVKSFWKRVGTIMQINVSPEQLQDMKIEEYLDIAATQLKYGNEVYAQLLADGARKTDTEEAPVDPVSKYESLGNETVAIRPLSSGKPKAEKPLDFQAKYELEGRDQDAQGMVLANPKGPAMQKLLQSYSGAHRRVLETVALLFPTLKAAGISINIHETKDSYANAVKANGGTDNQAANSGGFYRNKEVHINLSKPSLKENTALHEAFHPIIRDLLVKDKKVFKAFIAEIMADPEMRRRYYDEFAVTNYQYLAGQEDAIGEEMLVEASADIVMQRILRNMKDMPDKLFDRILKYIKDVLGDTYGKLAEFINTKEKFADFAETLADAISKGMVVPMNPDINDNIRTIVNESIQHSKQRAGNLFGGAAQTDLFGLMNNQMTLNQEKATPEALLRQKYFDLGYPAPNGHKSNLTPDQYYQVRTPEFKAWFGDWEKDTKNASKVVDENGEPLQVYRGDSSGRTVFDDKMTFFSENDYVAGSYSNEDANPEYKAFLNIRTPLNLRADNSKRIAGNDPEAVRLFEEAIDALPDDYEAFKGSGMNLTKAALKTFVIREHNGEKYIDFNAQSAAWEAVSEYAKKNGYDGVLMKDESADKYIQFARSQIVFSPTQIKSATDNTGAFDGNNPDIRFSMEPHDPVDSPEFKRWFGRSKVVDENGDPLVVYHGSTNYEPITKFRKGAHGLLGPGMYFTNQKQYATSYADRKGTGNGQVIDAYLHMENPYTVIGPDGSVDLLKQLYGEGIARNRQSKQGNINYLVTARDTKKLRDLGHDGIIYKIKDVPDAYAEYVVFEPTQVKSASKNNGEYSARNPDIMFSIMPDLVDGFYSPLQKTISEAKSDKLPVKQWVEKFAKGDEAKWTGLTDWLQSQSGSVSKSDILNYLKNNRVNIREVEKSDTDIDDEIQRLTTAAGAAEEDNRTIARELGSRIDPYEEFSAKEQETLWFYDTPSGEVVPVPDKTSRNGMTYIDRLNKNQAAIDGLQEKYDFLDRHGESDGATKYGQYTLPGKKENYKEVLVTLPAKEKNKFDPSKVTITKRRHSGTQGQFDIDYDGKPQMAGYNLFKDRSEYDSPAIEYTDAEIIETARRNFERGDPYNKLENQQGNFISNHWDEPNILTHIRMDTRTDANGEKTLFLEEVQSDWAQKYRKESPELKITRISKDQLEYVTVFFENGQQKSISKKLVGENPTDEKVRQAVRSEMRKGGGTPEAPFVTDTAAWTKLSLKVALKEAVKQGATKIAWTTGEQQAERYDLSKVLHQVQWNINDDGTYNVQGDTLNDSHYTKRNLDANGIEEHYGKDIANIITSSTEEEGVISNVDLKVGGRGMTGYYGDPAQNKLGILGNVAKSMFGDVGTTIINKPQTDINAREFYENIWLKTENPNAPKFDDLTDIEYDAVVSEYEEFKANERAAKVPSTQHSVTVTPELAKQVKTQGQPAFSVQPSHSEYEARVEKIKNELRHDILTNQDYNWEPVLESLKAKGLLTKYDVDDILGAWRNGKKLNLNDDQKLELLWNSAELFHLHRMDEYDNTKMNQAAMEEFHDAYESGDENFLERLPKYIVKELVEDVAASGEAHPKYVIENIEDLNNRKTPGGKPNPAGASPRDLVAAAIAMSELKKSIRSNKSLYNKTGEIAAYDLSVAAEKQLSRLVSAVYLNRSVSGASLGIGSKLLKLAGLTYESEMAHLEAINKAGKNIAIDPKDKETIRQLVDEINALKDQQDKLVLATYPKKDKAAAAERELTRKMRSSLESRPTITKAEAIELLRRRKVANTSFSLAFSLDPPPLSYEDIINELAKLIHLELTEENRQIRAANALNPTGPQKPLVGGFKTVVSRIQAIDPTVTENDIYKAILSTTPRAKDNALSEYAKMQALTRKHVKDINKVEDLLTKYAGELLRKNTQPTESQMAEFGELLKEIEKNIYSLSPDATLYTQWLNALQDIRNKYQIAFLSPTPTKDTEILLGMMLNSAAILKNAKFHKYLEAKNAKVQAEIDLINAGRVSELIDQEDKENRKYPEEMLEFVYNKDGSVKMESVPDLDENGVQKIDADGNGVTKMVPSTTIVNYNFGQMERLIQDKQREIDLAKDKYRKVSGWDRFLRNVLIAKSTVGSSMAIGDISVILNQGFKAALTGGLMDPRVMADAFGKSMLAGFDEFKKNPGLANQFEKEIHDADYYHISQKRGLILTNLGQHLFVNEMIGAEDAYDILLDKTKGRKNIAAQTARGALTVRKKIKDASNAQFATYLNVIAYNKFHNYYKKVLAATGSPPTDRELEALSAMINSALGRTGRLEGLVGGAQYFLWAPRLYLSHIINVANIIRDPAEFAYHMARGNGDLARIYGHRTVNSLIFAANVTALHFITVLLAKKICGDYSVNMNPAKPSFLKINCGELTLDPVSAVRQWAALGGRIFAAGTNKPYTDFMDRPVKTQDQLIQAFKYKWNPLLSTSIEFWDHSDFLGRDRIPGDDSFLLWKSRAAVLGDKITPIAGGSVVDIGKAKGVDTPGKPLLMVEAILGSNIGYIDAEKEAERDAIEKGERKEKKAEEKKIGMGQIRTRLGNLKELQGDFVGVIPDGIKGTSHKVTYSGKPYKVFKRTDDPNGDGEDNDYVTIKTYQSGKNKGKKYFDTVEDEKTKRFK